MKAARSDPLTARDRDPALRRREWRLERVGWGVMAIVVAAALLGAFGGGLLSHTEARGADGLVVDYHRMARTQSPEELTVYLPARRGMRSLRISAAFLARARLLEVDPAPIRVRLGEEERELLFDVEGGVARDGALAVVLRVEYRRAGAVDGWMAAGGGAPVRVAAFVYP